MSKLDSMEKLLIRHAKERGRNVAFQGPEWSMTYNELERRTRRIATNLLRSGIERGTFVAILLDRCLESVESVLAIARTGAIAVPLDPRSTSAELVKVLEHSGARLIITDSRHLGIVHAASAGGESLGGGLTIVITSNTDLDFVKKNASVVRYEELAESVDSSASWMEMNQGNYLLTEEDVVDGPAFLHYTSGTTSLPKGVLTSQYSWLCSANSFISAFGMTPEDHLFWPLPMFHCLGHALCIVATVVVGASAYLPDPDETLLNSLLTEQAKATTIMVGAPATYHELIATILTSSSKSTSSLALPRLRACMSAGAPATSTLSSQIQELLGFPLLNNYGCTEACGAILIQKPGEPYCEDSSGFPVPDIEIRLVDPDGKEVEADQDGEIWIRGPSLMLRYHKEMHSPFNEEGWFATGDIARRSTTSPHLKLIGRKKDLIVRGGENIQPEEVERVLRQCPGVADVVVAGASHRLMGETPVAFIVRENNDLDPTVLLAACRRILPDYKVPTAFYEIGAVPRTVLGKPKRSLVTSCASRPLRISSNLLSKESIEVLVLVETACACVLEVEHGESNLDWVRRHFGQPFTLLGLNSLAGVVLRDRLSSLTGLDLPNTLVFDYATPQAVSEYIFNQVSSPEPLSMPNPAPACTTMKDEVEPIAIISMACRYPGNITSPDDLWRVVADGLDVTSDFPYDRGWNLEALYSPDPDTPGTATTRRGAFLKDMADFDAGLFGMSPRESLATDPQQRLLLELTWELIERGGIAPSSLRGSQTGVYAGIMYDDYEEHGEGNHELEAHMGLGSSGSVVSGRISYCFDLHGPSICVHSGCSSSLVAVHLAIASLRSGESSLGIAGGVTTMATPRPFTFFSKRRGLSPDGRCRAYSSDAEGTGWSEGIGMLLLERLSDARRHGHQVLGLIRGSAINSDGASNGLTAPSGPAQQQVIQQALKQATLSPADVDVVEGHGTATPLGDPIEIQALISAYGNGMNKTRRSLETPLLLGSIKSNIGHSQAAAGVAGIIKMVQAIRHGVVPESIHITEPSRHIDWEGSGVELLTKTKEWPVQLDEKTGSPRPRRAAVSSFGIGGTNGHIILEQPVDDEQPPRPEGVQKRTWSCPWLLSGASETALRAQAQKLLEAQAHDDQNPMDIAFSLATSRSSLQYRAVVTPSQRNNYKEALAALADGRSHHDVATGAASGHTSAIKPRLACLFSGQGSRRLDSGDLEELCDSFSVFSEAFSAACHELDHHLEYSLYDAIRNNIAKCDDLIDRSDFAQAALFAFEVAMFRLLESFDLRPDFLTGHSLGEISAAHISGALTLREAATIVATRGKLMAAIGSNGIMMHIPATEKEVAEELLLLHDKFPGSMAVIAAVNSHKSVVVSGTEEAVMAVAEKFAALGRKTTKLRNVRHAFHSPMMEIILRDLEEALLLSLEGKGNKPLKIPLVSSMTGRRVDTAQLSSPKHWTSHVTQPVRFADAVKELQNHEDVQVFVEIGPSAVLSPHVPGIIATSSQVDKLLYALGQLWARGVQVNWQAVFKRSGACLVDLPVYAFQRRRYWLNPPKPGPSHVQFEGVGAMGHEILFDSTQIPGTKMILCSGSLSTKRQPWLRDHQISGQIMVPAAAFTELALRASRESSGTEEMLMLDEFAFVAPLILSLTGDEEFQIQVIIGEPQDAGSRNVDVYSRPHRVATQFEWTRHATGNLKALSQAKTSSEHRNNSTKCTSNGISRRDSGQTVDVPRAYAVLADASISYGTSFRRVSALWRPTRDGQAQMELQAHIDPPQAENHKFILHPTMLDAAMHASLLAASDTAIGSIRLPFLLRGVQFFATNSSGPLLARIRFVDEEHLSLSLSDSKTGALVAEITEVVLRPWQPAIAEPTPGDLYRLEWQESAHTTRNEGQTQFPSEDDEILRINAQDAGNGHEAVAKENVKDAVHSAVAEALRAVQKWSAHNVHTGNRLVIVTQKATVDNFPELAAAAVWGFVRSVQAELSGRRVALVDLDGSDKSDSMLMTALASNEEVISIRDGNILIPRLSKVAWAATQTVSSTLDIGGTVLITGGTGGLGALLGRHIIHEHGAQHLLLVSRTGRDAPGADQLYNDLRQAGAVVRIEKCDCGDRGQLAALLASVQDLPPITTIIHCAGVVDDAILSSQTPQRLSNVLYPKVDAAWNLHSLAPATVRSFVLFSSYVGIIGNEGQTGYTSGNAFLDALARLRVAQGLPSLSLAWGPWLNEGGMAAADRLVTPSARLANAQPFTDEQGLKMFDMALARETPAYPVMAPMLLRGSFPLVPSTGTSSKAEASTTNSSAPSSWRTKLSAVSPEHRSDMLLALVRDEVATVLGYQDQELPDLPFADLGFDSFTSVLLCNRLRALTGLQDLPVTLALDYDAVQAVVQYLSTRLDIANLEAETEAEDQALMSAENNTVAPQTVASNDKKMNGLNTSTPTNSQQHIDLGMFQGLASLHKRLSQLGQYTAAVDLMASASLALPTFGIESDLASLAVTPQLLVKGPSSSSDKTPPLIFIAPFFPPIIIEGFRSSVYSALASEMKGEREVYELPHPEEDSVPDSLETLTLLHVNTIRKHFSGPILLAGYSAGGTVAHSVASKLAEEEENRDQTVHLAGFVLIDTYLNMTGRGDPDWLNALPAEALTTRARGLESMVRDFGLALAKVGGYFRTFRDMKLCPLPVTLPTLFIRAQHPSSAMPSDPNIWRPSWPRANHTVEVPGSHLELLDKRYAPAAAVEIQNWARKLPS